MHREATMMHPILQAIFHIGYPTRTKKLFLCVFSIFVLNFHVILRSLYEGRCQTLRMYSTNISMAMISMGSDGILK